MPAPTASPTATASHREPGCEPGMNRARKIIVAAQCYTQDTRLHEKQDVLAYLCVAVTTFCRRRAPNKNVNVATAAAVSSTSETPRRSHDDVGAWVNLEHEVTTT